MNGSSKGRKGKGATSATGLFPDGLPSEAWQEGRRLKLFFHGPTKPQLDRIEFHANGQQKGKFGFLQRGYEDTDYAFRWTAMPQAISLFFLDYLNAGRAGKEFVFHGTPLTDSLADAVVKTNGKLFQLFVEFLPEGGGKSHRVEKVFNGVNLNGKGEGDRWVSIHTDYLPHDCIEISWGKKPITPEKLERFTELFRKVWKLPPPSATDFLIGDVAPLEKSTEPRPVEKPLKGRKSAPTAQKVREASSPGLNEQSPSLESPKTEHKLPGTPPVEVVYVEPKFSSPESAAEKPDVKTESQSSAKTASTERAPAKIDPSLFEIRNPGKFVWHDSEGLFNFGDEENDADVWRIRDASEGLIIFGAVGSGKTSSSGSLIAAQYLHAGYGGLVLTAKPDEAKRWLRLCERTGRMDDCIHVTPTSGHMLNILQYEAQRPGERINVTDDLVALFRTIIGVMSRSRNSAVKDDFWTNAVNDLMRNLFDAFLLSGEPLTIKALVRFINLAPKDPMKRWSSIEWFADIINRAEKSAKNGTDADRDVFSRLFDYWTKAFPETTDVTLSGVVAGFTSMAGVLGSRGINEALCQGTNLTPEMILSGKIVILDFPVKESRQGGNMVQATWKLLYQQAIERRADKGLDTARPVFLWEDEAHLFFSQNDMEFQPTARDCRASHVIISQNLHNFLNQGHDEHAVYSVFSATNTHIYHTNGDYETNCYASQRIGDLRERRLSSRGLIKGFTDKDYSIFSKQPEDVKSVGALSFKEHRERAIPPEDFSKLKRGGDGTCEAVVLWLSHQFAVNQNRNYCVRTFAQEAR